MLSIKTRKPREYVEGTEMSAELMERWLMAMTRAERTAVIDHLLKGSSRAATCFAMDHEGRLEETERRLSETLEANARLRQGALVL